MVDILMPQMGESIAEGTVTKWLKNVGDRVQRDEPLLEISTDKVDAEIPAPAAGVLTEIKVPAGNTVPVNSIIGTLAVEGEATQARPQPAAPPPPAATAPALPPAVAPPAYAPPPPPPAFATPPPSPSPFATPPAPQPLSPPPQQRPASEGGFPTQPPVPQPPSPSPMQRPASEGGFTPPERAGGVGGATQAPPTSMDDLRRTRSSPVVRKIAAEHHVDIEAVPGTGIAGRVTKQDILTHIESRPPESTAPAAPPRPMTAPAPAPAPAAPPSFMAPAPPLAPAAPAAPAPPMAAPATPAGSAPATGERTQVVPMSAIRRKTAEHMVASKQTSAHVTTVFEVDMSRVDRLRSAHRQAYEQRGVKLTYLPFIVKAVIDGLAAFPILNASVEGESIVYHRDVNVGIAVALDWGLIVPVIRSADEKNLLGVARAIGDLAERARGKRLKPDEVQGGTFTITNPGVFGGLFGTPIINQPQVAILGVGTIEKRPVVRDDAIAIRTMAYLALSFDHRIVDGADADRFMAGIKKSLEEFDESALRA